MEITAKYGVALTVEFPVVKAGAIDFAVTGDWTPATGDTKVSKDGGNVVNTSNNPAAVGGTGSRLWKLTLTATEMQAARVAIQIVDAAIEDQAIILATYGHASAQHAFDLDGDFDSIADAVLRMTTATIEAGGTPSFRTLYGLLSAMTHLHERNAADTKIILYESDDSTVLVEIPITKKDGLAPIQKVDPPA